MEKERHDQILYDRLKGALTSLMLGKRRVKYRIQDGHFIKSHLGEPGALDMVFCTQTILYIESYLKWLEQILSNDDFFSSGSTDILAKAYEKWFEYIKTTDSLDNTFWPQTEECAWLNEYMRSIAQWWHERTEGRTEEEIELNPGYILGCIRNEALFTAGAICSTTHSFDFCGAQNRKAWIYRLSSKYYSKKDDIAKYDYSLIWLNIMYVIINLENDVYPNDDEGKRTLINRIAAAGYVGTTTMGYDCFVKMSKYAKTFCYPLPGQSNIPHEIIRSFKLEAGIWSRGIDEVFMHTSPFYGMLYGYERMDKLKDWLSPIYITCVYKLVEKIICMRERIDTLLSADNDRLRNYIASL